jgi:hypothetical protein
VIAQDAITAKLMHISAEALIEQKTEFRVVYRPSVNRPSVNRPSVNVPSVNYYLIKRRSRPS